jgi:hypothetical protein
VGVLGGRDLFTLLDFEPALLREVIDRALAIKAGRDRPDLRGRVATLPVGLVERLARRVAPALTARFGSRARFWLQFEGCAVHPDDRSVDTLQQLGLQIQGAESARLQALQRRPRRGASA